MFEGEADQRSRGLGPDISPIPQREIREVSAQGRRLETDEHITAQIRADRFGRFKGLRHPGIIERNVRRAERSTMR